MHVKCRLGLEVIEPLHCELANKTIADMNIDNFMCK
jgi:hypothetical protein